MKNPPDTVEKNLHCRVDVAGQALIVDAHQPLRTCCFCFGVPCASHHFPGQGTHVLLGRDALLSDPIRLVTFRARSSSPFRASSGVRVRVHSWGVRGPSLIADCQASTRRFNWSLWCIRVTEVCGAGALCVTGFSCLEGAMWI